MRDTLSFLVFNLLERKDDPCKSDSLTISSFLNKFECLIHLRGAMIVGSKSSKMHVS